MIFLLPMVIGDIESYTIPSALCFILGCGSSLPHKLATTFAASVFCTFALLSTIFHIKLLAIVEEISRDINRDNTNRRDKIIKTNIVVLCVYYLISYFPSGLIYFLSLSLKFSSTFQYVHILILLPCIPILDPFMYSLANIRKTVEKLGGSCPVKCNILD